MNHDVTVSTTLRCRVLTLVCCLSVHAFLDSLAHGCPTYTGYMARWHLVAQHITWHMVLGVLTLVAQLYDLAHGCPTL